MQGADDGDPSAAPVPVHWLSADELKKTRIAYFEDDGRTPVTPETRAAVRRAAEILRAAGFQVEEFRPDGLEQARQVWWKFFGIAGGMVLREMTKGRKQDLSPMLQQFMGWVDAEPRHTADSLLDMWIQRDVARMKIFEQMNEFPILLCPAAAVPAFPHGERSWSVEGKTVKYLDAWSYTEWFNTLGMPAAVVPVEQSSEGLPIGVQIAGKPLQEELVLSIAEVIEQARGEWKAPPEIG
jgi:Asp-tRNA(Asn)/Glu-tRNA(Gln) amidotransferase A subunit family amidase